jgi:hypothetical protein
MRINLPSVFALFMAFFMYTNIASGNNPKEDYCFNADIPEAQMDFSDMCLTAPIISCPSTYLGCPNDNLDPMNTGFATAQPGDASCPAPIVTYSDVITTNTACLKVVHRTWSATYPAGSASIKLHSTCQQTLYLEDTQQPVINNCPANLSVDLAGNCDGIATWSIPTATDDCGIQSFTTTHFSGTSFPTGTTNVTYTATDFCNNSVTCSFSVTVSGSCCQAPVVNCPPNRTLCPGSSTAVANTGMATATISDPSCGAAVITFSDMTTNLAGCNGTNVMIQRTWTASDPSNSNLSTSCIQTISASDTQNPIVTNIPGDIIVSASGTNCSTAVTWNPPIATDNCGLASFNSTHDSGQVFSQGSTLVTYTAIDNCGNSATGQFLVTVQCVGCDANPIITCPSNYFGCPTTSAPQPSISGSASATAGSNMCGSPIVSFSDLVTSTGSCNAQTIQRTWTATDPVSGNFTSSCIQVLTLSDTQAPFISNIPNNITVTGTTTGNGCSAVANWSVPTATDNCGVASLNSNFSSGSSFPQGSTTVTYTATDNCGNVSNASFTVTVNCTSACNTPPTISCPSNYTACPTGSNPSTSVAGNATATSGSNSCPFPNITFSDHIISTGPCSGAKVIQRTFTATNPSNASLNASCVQTISLVDNQNPSFINCPSNIVLNASGSNCTAVANWGTILATDNCVTPSISAVNQNGQFVNSGSSFAQGVNTVTYTATDGCNNTATCVFTVTVNCVATCNTAPLITCPAPVSSLCIGADISTNALGNATATGGANCPTPVVSFSDEIVSQTSCSRVVKRTFTAFYTSGSNLTSSCTQNISLSDNQAPTILNCPTDIIISNPSTPVTWSAPYATDFCSTPTLTSNFSSGSTFPVGVTTVVYTAVDDCGNSATCSFNVIVNVNSSITCPSDINVSCGSNGGAVVNWPAPTVNGTCSDCNNGNFIAGFIYMGTLNGNQYYCSLSPATWANANAISQSNGGYLASIGSAEENNFLSNMLTIQSAWIGLNDIETEGTFEWASGEPVNYTNWYPGQPNNYNGTQHCVEILNNGQWNDQYGTYQLEFIMEKPCSSVNQVAGPAPGTFLTGGNYTVTYQISDACGSVDQCSFNITVESALSLTCPNNINTSAPSNSTGVAVNWNLPTVSSCCSNCTSGGGQAIPGFIYMGAFNGHHYYCSTAAATWPTAKASCEANGGYLTVINGAAENAYLANLLTLQSAWIGLSDTETEGNFQWVNGDALDYTNWYPGQPNNYNGSQDYVELLNNGQWNDQYNHFALEYIMEIPGCLNLTQTAGPAPGSILAPGSNHTVTYRATDGCGNVETCSFNINVASVPVGNGYCPSSGQNSNNYFIESLLFNTINNYSGNNGGYKDFTSFGCTTVSPGQSYPLHLDPGFAGVAATKVYWKVWIDYNMDGDFDDASEYAAYGCGDKTLSGTITMPYTLWNGNTVMRVAMKVGGYPSSPCDVFPYGEVEDYCVKVINAGDFNDISEIDRRSDDGISAVLLSGVANRSDVEIYPNPVSEYLTINLSQSDNVSSIQLYSIDGRMVNDIRQQDISNRNQINVSQYENGMYLLRVIHTDGEVSSQKITIHH